MWPFKKREQQQGLWWELPPNHFRSDEDGEVLARVRMRTGGADCGLYEFGERHFVTLKHAQSAVEVALANPKRKPVNAWRERALADITSEVFYMAFAKLEHEPTMANMTEAMRTYFDHVDREVTRGRT